MKAAKPATRTKRTAKTKSAKSTRGRGKASQGDGLPKLEPDHPNFDTILLRRSRLETYRARRKKNRPDLFAK